jgi:hypothetical protein
MSFPDAINSQFESRKKEFTGKRNKKVISQRCQGYFDLLLLPHDCCNPLQRFYSFLWISPISSPAVYSLFFVNTAAICVIALPGGNLYSNFIIARSSRILLFFFFLWRICQRLRCVFLRQFLCFLVWCNCLLIVLFSLVLLGIALEIWLSVSIWNSLLRDNCQVQSSLTEMEMGGKWKDTFTAAMGFMKNSAATKKVSTRSLPVPPW